MPITFDSACVRAPALWSRSSRRGAYVGACVGAELAPLAAPTNQGARWLRDLAPPRPRPARTGSLWVTAFVCVCVSVWVLVCADCNNALHCNSSIGHLHCPMLVVTHHGFASQCLSCLDYQCSEFWCLCFFFTANQTLTRQLLRYFATRDLLGGGGVKRPHVITRERMVAERRATRRSKALDESILKRPLNFPNEVTCQVKVRSKVKIGAFLSGYEP